MTAAHLQTTTATPTDNNVRTIAQLESMALEERSLTDRVSDTVTRIAGSGAFIALHVVWFSFWVLLNAEKIPGLKTFDPFPFTFLTMIVSLEAIFLSIFVLISQNRMTRQADRRAHLDLQINLLAEQENTMMLHMLRSLCERHGIQPELPGEDAKSLFNKTDLHKVMQDLQNQLPEG
jgi:uncharacterized membrane protein